MARAKVSELPKMEVVEGTVPDAFIEGMEGDGWTRQSQDIEGWETGKTVEGTLIDIRDGNLVNENGTKAKLLHVMDTQGVERIIGCPTVLANRLERVQGGKRIYVICTGKAKTRAGRMAWGFEVFTR